MLKPIESVETYLQPTPMNDPGPYTELLGELPTELPKLVKALQHMIVHMHWAKQYGVKLTDDRKFEADIRTVRRRLARLQELDPGRLMQFRPVERRQFGCCRDYSMMIAAFLRSQGVPARSRAGFGTYFTPGKYEDHWVAEYWSAEQNRWVMIDAQLDDLQKKVLHIRFDSLDMPPGQFINGGQAWQMCRRGEANPDDFGIFEWHGWDFLRGNVMRDLAALNKIEALPWDDWGMMATRVADSSPAAQELIDEAAAICASPTPDVAAAQALYAVHPELQIPVEWMA